MFGSNFILSEIFISEWTLSLSNHSFYGKSKWRGKKQEGEKMEGGTGKKKKIMTFIAPDFPLWKENKKTWA